MKVVDSEHNPHAGDSNLLAIVLGAADNAVKVVFPDGRIKSSLSKYWHVISEAPEKTVDICK